MADVPGAAVLAVSQFTLYGDATQGPPADLGRGGARVRRRSRSSTAFVTALRELGAPVQTGIFGADMRVELINDGPVTLLLETEFDLSPGRRPSANREHFRAFGTLSW